MDNPAEEKLLQLARTGASITINGHTHSNCFIEQLAHALREDANLTILVASDDSSDIYLNLALRNPQVSVMRY